MPSAHWDQRFFASTRGQLVLLLHGTGRTVHELAKALELTENGIRTQLAVLERDGLVRHEILRRGVGKPAYIYKLTPQADSLFPKAHGAVLAELLDALDARLGRKEVVELLRSVGQRIASRQIMPAGDLRERL